MKLTYIFNSNPPFIIGTTKFMASHVLKLILSCIVIVIVILNGIYHIRAKQTAL